MGKGVLGCAQEGAFLHCVVLLDSRDDHLGWSRQAYHLCTDFQDVNKRILVDGYPALDL